jgi:AcrR family transcriptional regulator
MKGTLKKKRGRPKDETLRARREDEILDAAAAIFAKHGYPNTEVQLVADTLQVGKGTIYRYFPSKEGLFLAAVDRGMRRLKEVVDAATTNVSDPLGRLGQGIRAYLTFFRDHPEYVELLIQERAEFRDRKKPTYFVHRDLNRGPWQEFFRSLIAAGRVRDLPVERILDMIGDLMYGTMFTNYFTGRHRSLDEQSREILDFVFHGILSDSERKARFRR